MDGVDEPGGAVPDVSGRLEPREQPLAAAAGEWGDDLAASYRRASMPASTRAAYAGDWDRFTRWCSQTSSEPLPAMPTALSRYLARGGLVGRGSGLGGHVDVGIVGVLGHGGEDFWLRPNWGDCPQFQEGF